MAINKVVYGGETLMDLTGDTVTPQTLAAGVTAHTANGEQITGVAPTTAVLYTGQSLTDAQKAQARANIGIPSEEEIIQGVIAALGTPVFGTVDENKHITLSGHLVDGMYTISFEDADGFVVADAGTIKKGESYTNQIPISIDTDGSVFNGKGWEAGMRLNSSGAVVDGSSYGYSAVTGFIPFKDGDTLRGSAGMYLASGSSQQGICFYKSDKTFIRRMAQTTTFPSSFKAASDGSFEYTLSATGDFSNNADMANVAFVRCCFYGIDADAIITVNEPIV